VEKGLAEKKKKGRRMQIEEVDGSEDQEEERTPSPSQMNGHVAPGDSQEGGEVLQKSEKIVQEKQKLKEGKDIWNSLEVEDRQSDDISEKNDVTNSECDESDVKCAIDAKDDEVAGETDVGSKVTGESDTIRDTEDAKEVEQEDDSEESVSHTRPVFVLAPLPTQIEDLRQAGNGLFRTGQYADALVKYEDAINALDQSKQ